MIHEQQNEETKKDKRNKKGQHKKGADLLSMHSNDISESIFSSCQDE